MNLQDLELIALRQIITLYKNRDTDLNEALLSVSTIKKQLVQGTPFADPDSDIDIVNIKNTIDEPDITIVNQNSNCNSHPLSTDQNHITSQNTDTNFNSNLENSINNTISTAEIEDNSGIKGKLFQYFKGGKNAGQ